MQRLLVISPCRDEAAFLERSLASVVGQSVRPDLWIIVDDGSSDGSSEILDAWAARHEWIRVLRRDDRGGRSVGPGVVEAFEFGLASCDASAFEFLCKLDVDLDLPPRMFELLLARMDADPRLGTLSGKPYFVNARGKRVDEVCGDEMSVGMTKLYRRSCFEEIGGLVPNVMWDGIDCHRARMLGWKAGSVDDPELAFEHLRPMGSSGEGTWAGRQRHGRGQYFMGTGLVYLAGSALYRLGHPPAVIGGLGILVGYLKAILGGAERYDDAEFRRFLKQFQWACLRLGKRRATARFEAGREWLWNRHHAPGSGPVFPQVELCGVRFDAPTEAQCVEHVVSEIGQGRGGWIVTPNLDHLRRLVADESFRSTCAPADLAVADGMPLVWAGRLQGTPFPERVAGSHLITSLSVAAGRAGRSVYLLGGDEGTAEAAAEVLQARCPGLRIAGTDCPAPGFEADPERMRQLVGQLTAAQPDIVYVALGSPKQERLIGELRGELPGAWWIGIGISFSFLSGDVRRAPPWMQRVGLEWLHRLAQEPRRLARRYLVDGLPFAARLLVESAWRRVRRPAPGR